MRVPLVNGHADLECRIAVLDGASVKLSPNEVKLFAYLAERADQTVDHDVLLRDVFGYADGVRSRTVTTTMQRLRKKVEADPAEPVHLCSVFGRGYRFESLDSKDGLIGRTEELATIARRLEEEGRLWVVAPGGFGKSVLARRFARSAADSLFVDLTELGTVEELTGAVGSALGLRKVEGPEVLSRALRHRRPSVVVLDAAEHLGDTLVPFVAAWSSFTRVLVTTRRPCGPEPTLALGPLAPADAERLFVRCAPPAVAPERLAALLEGLQGVPLALELAAARLSVFTPELLAALLDDLDTLLAGGEGRQASMRAVLGWSWQHTPPALRQALALLTPSREGLAESDALALFGAGGEALLAQLRQWGWVQRRGDRLFLLDPVRQFVESATDTTAAHDAHMQCFLAHARRVDDAAVEGTANAFLLQEWANFRAAFRHAAARGDAAASELALLLTPALMRWEPSREVLRWLDIAVDLAEGDLESHLLVERASFWQKRASLDAAEVDLERASRVGRPRPGWLAYRQAIVARGRGRVKEAIELCREAAATIDGPMALNAQVDLGHSLMLDGQLDAAREVLTDALARAQARGAPSLELVAWASLANVYTATDEFDRALEAYEAALESVDEDRNITAGTIHLNLGNLHCYAGRPALAIEHWSITLELCQRLGHREGQAVVEIDLALLALVDRDFDRAERLLRSALATAVECHLTSLAAHARQGLGRTFALQRAWAEAERWFALAEPDIPMDAAWVFGVERCVALAEQGQPEAARAAWEAGVEGIDAGSRASRALAAGFWHAAFLERGSDDASVHRQGIVDALRAADAIRDPIVRDFADRLRAKLPAG